MNGSTVSRPPISTAGDAEASSRNRPADGENIGGASRPGSLLLGGEKGSGLCFKPERGPPALPAVRAAVPLPTSRGRTCRTEE